MNAAKIVRELAELDKLEKMVRGEKNPSSILLDGIKARRAEILNPNQGDLLNASPTQKTGK